MSTSAFATHIIGGEIYYDCLGGDEYKVTVDLFRDCNSTGAAFDSPLKLAIYRADGSLFQNVAINFPGSTTIPLQFDNPCVTTPSNICVQRALYTKTISLPPIVGGYTLSYQRCCRGPAVINLTNPDDAGLTLTTHIPGSETGIDCNSSPRFTNYPPLALCNTQLLDFNHSATDPDGDVIIYELCTPFHGGTSLAPAPDPASAPPYNMVNWETGFSETEPMGNGSNTSIDANSGTFQTTPQFLGKYAVGICAKEYRNGVLIGETRRDFLFTVVNCDVALASVITPQNLTPGFVSYCQGLEINFTNQSFGGTKYFWDFGVDEFSNDTSNLANPSYLYPNEGEYTVTLILNKGWPCTDTATAVFKVFKELNVESVFPAPQCITGNSFDFEANAGDLTGVDYSWDFGPNSNPNTASNAQANNITFDTTGYITVEVRGIYQDCEGSYIDSILVHSEPTIDFWVDPELKCAPYVAHFIDSSISSTPLTYIWDFGDGSELGNTQNPFHTYDSPGFYDVSLTVATDSGCIQTLTLNKPDYIQVYPSPTADFTASPYETDVFNPFITFNDYSIDSEVHAYFFTDGDSTQERNITHTYDMSGYIYPYQVVWNEFGCPDTLVQEIYIKPITTIYVPNAFTPDGDGFNDLWQPIIRDVVDYELIVYDRWGNEIIKTNDQRMAWDGKNKGQNAMDGTYTYVIHYRGYNKTGFDYVRGHFTLLR